MSQNAYLDFPVGPTPTPKMIRDAMGEPEEKTPLGSLFGDAFMDTTVTGSVIRYFERPGTFDPSFRITPELLKDTAGDIPVEYIQDLSESTSLDEFKYRVESIKERLDTREKLSQHGIAGLGLTFGAALLDPAFLVGAGVAAPLVIGGKAAQVGVATQRALRVQSALRGAAISAAIDIPLETARLATDDMSDFETFFINVIASGTLGSGIGYAFPTTSGFARNWKQMVDEEKGRIALSMQGKVSTATGVTIPQRNLSSMNKKEVFGYAKELGVPTTRPVAIRRTEIRTEEVFDPTTGGKMEVEVEVALPVDETVVRTPDFDQPGQVAEVKISGKPKMVPKTEAQLRKDIQEFLDKSPEVRAGEAAVGVLAPNDSKFLEFTDEVLKDMVDDVSKPTFFGEALSRLPFFRAIAKREARVGTNNSKLLFRSMVEDPMLDSRMPDLETRATLNRRTSTLPYYQALRAIEEAEGKAALQLFRENIADAVRSGRQLDGLQGQAQKALQKSFAENLEHARRMGVDVSGIKPDMKFIPREANQLGVMAATDAFGKETVIKLLKTSLKRANPKMSDSKITSVAEGWFKYAEDPEGYVNARLVGGKSADKIQEIEKVLKARMKDKKEVDEVLDLLVPKGHQPHLGMTNKRINFDESMSITAINSKTGKSETLKFSDLVVNDMDYLLEKYTHRLTGAAGMTQMARVIGVETAGEGVVPTIDDFVRFMNTDGKVDDITMTSFEQAYRNIMGMPQRDLVEFGENYRKALGTLRDLSFVNVMANVGVAQLPELANSMASNGVRAMLTRMPALMKMTRNLKTGKWNDQVAAELEAFLAPSEGILNGYTRNYRMDEGLGLQSSTGSFYERAMRPLRAVTSGAGSINVGGAKVRNFLGIAPMDDALRIGHVNSTLQSWVNRAYKVKNGRPVKDSFFDKSRSRFRDLGFTDNELDELMETLADVDAGVVRVHPNSTKVAQLDLSKFSNQQLRYKLQFALQRDADRVIQRNKIGNKDFWFNTPSGGLVTQFRQFALTAGYKQLGYNLKHMDQTAIKMFAGTTMFAYVGYLINIHIGANKYSGIEREKFLEEALGFHEFMDAEIPRPLLAAVTRAGWSGLFPAFIDSGTARLTPDKEALFSPYFRSTGLGVGLIEGIPAYSYLSDTLKSLTEVSRAGAYELTGGKLGGQFTEKDMRSLLRLVPLRNSIIINRPLEQMAQELNLPKRED